MSYVCSAIHMLCEAGADINIPDLVGRTPMWLAVCKDGHVSHLRRLLCNKYGPNMCELDYPDLREKRTAIQVTIYLQEFISSPASAGKGGMAHPIFYRSQRCPVGIPIQP